MHAAAPVGDRERHAAFLAHMLLLAFAALAVAPLFLAFHGAPTPVESLLFGLSLAPAAAAMLVARTGRLVLGHLVAAAGFAGIALVLFLGLRSGPGAAIAWLVAAHVEAMASPDRRLARAGTLFGGAALAAIVALCLDKSFASTISSACTALLASLAVVASALAARRMTAMTGRLDVSGATRETGDGVIETLLGAVVLGLDAGGSVLSLSNPDDSFLTVPDHAILGRGLLDRVLVADRPAFLKLIDDAAHGTGTFTGTLRMRASDGETDGRGADAPLFMKVEMRTRHGDGPSARDPQAARVVAVLTDATERDEAEREIAEARRAIDEALRTKDQFLTTMSHELHTPLNAVIGFSDILASRTNRPADVARQCELARIINQSGRHLLAIVDTVLDLSRIQSGAFDLRAEPFEAKALLDRAAETVANRASEGSLRLVRDFPAVLEPMNGDRPALERALVALLANAVKFTPARGQVTLTARPQGNALVVTVSDTGIGIAAEDFSRIGAPFFQASGSTSRPYDGAGLGLALARGLVGLHGGTLAIESAVGVGTRVTMKLPLDCRAMPADAAAAIATTILQPARHRPSMPIKDAA